MAKEKFVVTVLRPIDDSDGSLIEIASHVSVISILCGSIKKAKKLARKIELTEISSDYKVTISPQIKEDTREEYNASLN